MTQCEQAPGLNMLQHGEAVHEQFKLLKAEDFSEDLQKLFKRLPPAEVLKPYHIYHDCGKHLCLEVGDDGKRRFPDHAEWSYKQYLHLFPDDVMTATLIRMDLGFHTYRGEELLKLCKHPLAPILYFTAWAEINANAEMFGGRESESYKIKRSRLIQAGKKLVKEKA